jgi:hypothetical protein
MLRIHPQYAGVILSTAKDLARTGRLLSADATPTPRSSATLRMAGILVAAMCLAAAAELPAAESKKPSSPREMFRALGVDDAHFDRLADGQPLGARENETLWRVLFRLRAFASADIERWALSGDELAAAVRQPEKSRGTIFRLDGRVTDVEPIRPPSEAVQRYELARYFRCRLELGSPPELADVYTENVPAEWQKGARPNVSGGARGVFLKCAEKIGGRPLLIFAARRLAWYPDTPLGRLDMDVGLLDSAQARKPFNQHSPEDREAFYQMLAAVGRATAGQLFQEAKAELPKIPAGWRRTDQQGQPQYSVVPLFNEPAGQRGRLVELFGTARLVEEIHLDPLLDADIIARFGFDHYYQVSLFTDDSQGNPLTFCIRQLPEGMPYGNRPHYGETVRIAGFFFKTWSYSVPKMADPALTPGNPKTQKLLSPLLIGRSLVWYPAPQPAENTLANYLIGGLVLLFIVMIWLAGWRNRRHEKKWLAEIESPP